MASSTPLTCRCMGAARFRSYRSNTVAPLLGRTIVSNSPVPMKRGASGVARGATRGLQKGRSPNQGSCDDDGDAPAAKKSSRPVARPVARQLSLLEEEPQHHAVGAGARAWPPREAVASARGADDVRSLPAPSAHAGDETSSSTSAIMPVSKAQAQAAAASAAALASAAPAAPATMRVPVPVGPVARTALGTLTADAAATRLAVAKAAPVGASAKGVAHEAKSVAVPASVIPPSTSDEEAPLPLPSSQPSRLFFFAQPAPAAPPEAEQPLPWQEGGAGAAAARGREAPLLDRAFNTPRQRKRPTPWYVSGKFSWEGVGPQVG